MNIFYLDENPKVCAQYHLDKHVVKMIVEYAQLMSTAHRVLDGEEYYDLSKNGRRVKRYRLNDKYMDRVIYKACHINHPSTIWTRSSSENYKWLFKLWNELCKEYTYRYKKQHSTFLKLGVDLVKLPKNIEKGDFYPPTQAMPDYCKDESALTAYRKYYINEKMYMAKYTGRELPEWLKIANL
jgi:hypothetical protein